MSERGTVTSALLGIGQPGSDAGDGGRADRGLAERICRACVNGLDIDGAALSLLTASVSRETLWATDATAELLEDLQFTLNEGACMEAAATGRPVFVADLHDGSHTVHWPIFAAAVAEQTEVRALFALPLQWGAVNLGVLDLYRTVPGELPESQWRDVLAAADTAALMMVGARTDPDGHRDPGQGARRLGQGGGWLDHALGHRAEIHQATGMVLAQLGISATDALARMRAHAFVHQLLLIDVARDVVDRNLVFTPDLT